MNKSKYSKYMSISSTIRSRLGFDLRYTILFINHKSTGYSEGKLAYYPNHRHQFSDDVITGSPMTHSYGFVERCDFIKLDNIE